MLNGKNKDNPFLPFTQTNALSFYLLEKYIYICGVSLEGDASFIKC